MLGLGDEWDMVKGGGGLRSPCVEWQAECCGLDIAAFWFSCAAVFPLRVKTNLFTKIWTV